MKILALDQASRVTGWAIFDNAQLINSGTIVINPDYGLGERLHKLRNEVKDIIQTQNIEKVYLEDIYADGQHINNISTFKTLAEVFGVLFELCVDLKVPVEAVLAIKWKSVVGIKGRTRADQKKSAKQHVLEKYKIKASEDQADSICIGEYAIIQQSFNWGE